MAEGRIQIIAELIDRLTGPASRIIRQLRGVQMATQQLTIPMQQAVRAQQALTREFQSSAAETVVTAGAFYAINRAMWEQMGILGRLRARMAVVGSYVRGLQRNMGGMAWTFTWAALSMMGVLWNFQWMLRVFLDPLKMVIDSLTNFVDAAFNVAYWLALGQYFGLDFAERLGGVDKAILKVVESGMFLAATVGGLMSLFMVALAEALKTPGVMDAIVDAITALIDVMTDPAIIKAIADIIKGFAEMARELIPMIPPLIPLIDVLLKKMLGFIPVIGAGTSGFVMMGRALAVLFGLFIALQPVLVPLMTLFSVLSAILVQVMIWGKAVGYVFGILSSVANKLSGSLGGLIGRIGGVVSGLYFLARGLWDVIQHGWNLKNVTDMLVGAGWILVAFIGGPLSAAAMAVVTIVKMVIDYFDWWDEIINAVTGSIRWLVDKLSVLYSWLTRVTGPLSSVAGVLGLGGVGRAAAAPAGPTTQYVYQTVSIGTVRETVELDAALRRLAEETRRSLGGRY